MAKVVDDGSGFKVIEISRAEIIGKLGSVGAVGICDYCGKSPDSGFYVAVLNQWICPECYRDFISRNKPEPEDSWYEDRMYNKYKQLFNV